MVKVATGNTPAQAAQAGRKYKDAQNPAAKKRTDINCHCFIMVSRLLWVIEWTSAENTKKVTDDIISSVEDSGSQVLAASPSSSTYSIDSAICKYLRRTKAK